MNQRIYNVPHAIRRCSIVVISWRDLVSIGSVVNDSPPVLVPSIVVMIPVILVVTIPIAVWRVIVLFIIVTPMMRVVPAMLWHTIIVIFIMIFCRRRHG